MIDSALLDAPAYPDYFYCCCSDWSARNFRYLGSCSLDWRHSAVAMLSCCAHWPHWPVSANCWRSFAGSAGRPAAESCCGYCCFEIVVAAAAAFDCDHCTPNWSTSTASSAISNLLDRPWTAALAGRFAAQLRPPPPSPGRSAD